MSTSTNPRGNSVPTQGRREAATLESLKALMKEGLIERGMSVIVKAHFSLEREPSRASAHVDSLNISFDDMKAALTVSQPCPETQIRYDAARDAVRRDIQLTEWSQAIEVAKDAGDTTREEALKWSRNRLMVESANSWAWLAVATLAQCEEWEARLEELKQFPSGDDSRGSDSE